jgi:hypothetical protein
MKRILLAGACAFVSACSTFGGPSSSASLTATKDFTIAETSFDAVIKTADNVIDTGAVPAATVAKIHTLGDAGYVYVKAGRTAVTAANAPNIIAETAALTALVPQIAALIPTK